MADDSSPSSPTVARPKPTRTITAGTVRSRASPPPGQSSDQVNDGRPPTKRARKAINCEPCRNSKLKCDRNRPCSSCVLRGTSAMCYQDGRGPEGNDPLGRGDDNNFARIDPAQEIARLRHSISLLEAYVFPAHRNHALSHRRASDAASFLAPKKESTEEHSDKAVAPGMLGSQVQGGLYAGPTSAAAHLLISESRDSDEGESRQQSQDRTADGSLSIEYDRDLLALLPNIEVIDGLITYYFEYCNWIYRHINQATFSVQWERFKNGSSADRIVLASACVMMAIAVHYLPQDHHLIDSLNNDSHEEAGIKFYEVSSTALQRRLSETRAYSLELVELLLCRCHFLTLSKTDSEEIWHVRGELVTIGMAMGLHRDPGKWRMHRDVAERRRWAWWHIVLLERWQAFMFGRPLAVASHHFDTQLPSYCDPAVDKTGRLYLPNIALFRLAFILGDIMDDAVSVRPVPYESVQANDRALTQWMENIPPELDLEEYRVARSLASPHLATRRQGVQSVIIRTSYYHIRFTLHRPYASANPHPSNNSKPTVSPEKQAQSLEIAVSAADKLITMVGQSRPDFLANSSLAVPGHMNWGPFHCFSAAMFFSFQLIANPDQPGAGLFRQSIRKAITTLEQCRGTPFADKAYNILHALTPLYSQEFPQSTTEDREKQRAQVMGVVKKLAFPYHDSHDPRRYGDSPSARGGTVGSPANSSSVSPPMAMMQALPQHYDSLQSHTMSSMRTPTSIYSQQGVPPQSHIHALSQSPQAPPQIVHHPQSLAGVSTSYQQPQSYSAMGQPQMYPDNNNNRYGMPYVHAVDETIWGAAVGFGQGEWTTFLESANSRNIHNS